MNYYNEGTVYECDKVIEAWGLNYRIGNVAKYICRAGKKTPDPTEDHIKAIDYLLKEIVAKPNLTKIDIQHVEQVWEKFQNRLHERMKDDS